MGITPHVAINEGVSLLESLSPDRLRDLRKEYPSLASDLKLGISAGLADGKEDSAEDPIVREKAQIMIAALAAAEVGAERALAFTSRRVNSARRQRLISQVLVLIGSSSSLGTLALSQNRAAVIASVLTLVAAVGNLLADFKEKLLNPQVGNIYDAFQRLSEGVYKSRAMATDLTLALKYSQDTPSIARLVANANMLCEDLNGWLIQMVSSIPQVAR